MEADIDGVKEIIELPYNFKTRRNKLLAKYNMPMGKHLLKLSLLNPDKMGDVILKDIIIYSDKPAKNGYRNGKQLSHGTFRLEGKMIRYTEFLEGNRKREFPFLIKKITDSELIFETMEQNFTRITARKAD